DDREPRYDACSLAFGQRKESKGQYEFAGQLLGERVIGYQHNDPQIYSQLVSNGVYLGEGDQGSSDPKTKELLKGVGDWQYLFQFDDSVSALFFLIKKSDLQTSDFDGVWFHLQTT